MYNDYLYPDEDGIVIFYEFADGLTKDSFRIGFDAEDGVLCNTVYETLYYNIDSVNMDTYEFVKSADYNINSYVYNKSGTLITYGINTFISSIGDDIIEVRTKPRDAGSEFVSFLYKLEYKRISDGSVIYSNDNCISSTGFNEGYAVISEGYADSLLLTVINSDGEIICKKMKHKFWMKQNMTAVMVGII